MVPIIATESGRCISEPRSDVKSRGTMANTVVSVVMMMALSLRCPAVWMASSSGMPSLRSSLMESSFRMESFTTIPQETMMPMADIRFNNFCVYFAAEPQLMGQNPALYENVSRLVQFWL